MDTTARLLCEGFHPPRSATKGTMRALKPTHQPPRPAVTVHTRVSKRAKGRGERETASTLVCQATGTSVDGQVQHGLVFPTGEPHAWDTCGVGNPVVRCYMGDDEQRWYMWYNGFPEASATSEPPQPSCIGVAISDDGLQWHRGSGEVDGSQGPAQLRDVGRVLAPNTDWWWHDTRHVSVSDVQIFSSDAVNTGVGVYWMFYTGGNFETAHTPTGLPDLPEGQEVEGLRTRIGLAMSQDGRNWARIEANHHSGALFDAGAEDEWDSILNGHPQVLALGPSEMRMYFHTFSQIEKKWLIGYATSKDGFNWRKRGPIFNGGEASDFDAKGAAAHCVVRDVDSGRFVMFYEAVGNDDSRSISIAVSKDGLTGWKRLGRPILLGEGPHAWDSAAVGAPCAVSMADRKWRLYYCGKQKQSGPWQGIGLAITDAESNESFEGIRVGFKRRVPRAS